MALRLAGFGLAGAMVAGVVVIVSIRTQLAENIAKDAAEARAGAPLDVDVTALDAGGAELRNLALGAPDGPGLRVGRAVLRWRLSLADGMLDITSARLEGVEVRARLDADGGLDLGPLGRLIAPTGEPARLRVAGLDAPDARLVLETAQGRAQAVVAAAGGEAAGWRLRATQIVLPAGLRARRDAAGGGTLSATFRAGAGSAVWRPEGASLAFGEVRLIDLSGAAGATFRLGDGKGGPLTVRLEPGRLTARAVAAPGVTAATATLDMRRGTLAVPPAGLRAASATADLRATAGRLAAGTLQARSVGLDLDLSRNGAGAITGSAAGFAAALTAPGLDTGPVRLDATPKPDLRLARLDDPATLQGRFEWRLDAMRVTPAPSLLAPARAALAGPAQPMAQAHMAALTGLLDRIGAEGLSVRADGDGAVNGVSDIALTLTPGATATGAGLSVKARGAAPLARLRLSPGGAEAQAAGALDIAGPGGLTGAVQVRSARLNGALFVAQGAVALGPWTLGGRTAQFAADPLSLTLRGGAWSLDARGGARWQAPELQLAVSEGKARIGAGPRQSLQGAASGDVRFAAPGAAGATRIEAALGGGTTRLGRLRLATPFGVVEGDGVAVEPARGGAGATARTAGCLRLTPNAALSAQVRLSGPLRLCPDARGLRFGADGGALSGEIQLPAAEATVGDGAAMLAPARVRADVSWRTGRGGARYLADLAAANVAVTGKGGALDGAQLDLGQVSARVGGAGADWSLDGAVRELQGALAGVRMSGATTFTAGVAGGTLDAQVSAVDLAVSDLAPAPRFAPLRATGTVVLSDNLADGVLDLALDADGTRLGALDVLHDVTAGAGGARFTAEGLAFSRRGLQPDAIAPLLEGLVANADGPVEVGAEALWAPGAPVIATGRLATSGIDFATGVGPFERVSGAVELEDLFAVRSAPGQTVRVGRFNPGLPIDDGLIVFGLPGGARIALEEARWPFAGGTLALKPDVWVIGAPRQDLNVDVIDVDLGRFLELARIPDLTVTGVVNGRFPIVVENTIARIEGGRLIAQGGGGVIAYQGPAAQVAAQNAGAKLAFDALANLRYRVLEIGVDGPLTGDLSLRFLFEGANPDVMSGYPIRFNLGATGPFAQLARTLGELGSRGQAIGERVRDEIERQQRVPAPAPAPEPASEPGPP